MSLQEKEPNTDHQNEMPPGPQGWEQDKEAPKKSEELESNDKDKSHKKDAVSEQTADKKDDPKAKRRFTLVLAAMAGLLALLLLVGLVPRLRAKPTLEKRAKENSDSVPEVEVAYPKRSPDASSLTLPGNIQALQESDISARSTGYVRQWLVDIGDTVKQGQVLAVVDTPEVDQQAREAAAQLAQARAQVVQQRSEEARAIANLAQSRQNAERQRQQLEQAKADLNLAKVTRDRWDYLVKEGAISRQSADEKRAAFSNNRANVAALEAAVNASQDDISAFQAALGSARANVGAAQENAKASQANLDRFGVLRSFQKVRAPFSGVITARLIDSGALIGSNGAASAGSSGGGVGGGSSRGSASSGGAAGQVGGAVPSSSRSGMYGSTPDTGIAGGAPQGAPTTSGFGSYGDSQAAGGRPVGSAGGNGAEGQSGPANGGSATGNGSSQGAAGAPDTGGVGGAVVSPGTSLYRVARLDVLRIQVNVPQSFAPNIRVGAEANLQVSEYPAARFVGRVTRTASSLDPQTRTMLTEIQISNKDRRLLPGMYAQVVFKVTRLNPPLIVPASALIADAKGTQIATITRENKVKLNPVVVGRDYGQSIEIAAGISPNEKIVLDPTDATKDGAEVTPVPPKQEDSKDSERGQGSQPKSGEGANGNPGSTSSSGPRRQESQGGQGKPKGPPPNLGQSYGGGLDPKAGSGL
jgi:multidrug efflux pump subunit AcrA (membrane-fusion protein)